MLKSDNNGYKNLFYSRRNYENNKALNNKLYKSNLCEAILNEEENVIDIDKALNIK